ncbi:MAG TPA: hypothetical protein VFW13_12620 [Phenylobacterium sp.]|nr:hypothetical protein [Phenylobacterium sp.]
MSRSDRAICTVALAPIAIYLAAMATTFALNPSHFPGAMFGAGGGIVAMGAVGVANTMRLYRDRRRGASRPCR